LLLPVPPDSTNTRGYRPDAHLQQPGMAYIYSLSHD